MNPSPLFSVAPGTLVSFSPPLKAAVLFPSPLNDVFIQLCCCSSASSASSSASPFSHSFFSRLAKRSQGTLFRRVVASPEERQPARPSGREAAGPSVCLEERQPARPSSRLLLAKRQKRLLARFLGGSHIRTCAVLIDLRSTGLA